MEVRVFTDRGALADGAADLLAEQMAAAVRRRGRADIVLTGGSVGIAVLAGLRDRAVDWSSVHLYWGDERYVPADDDDRNAKQAAEALLDHIDIPPGNVHPMASSDGQFGDNLDAAAASYERVLAAQSEKGAPTPDFDVHLLGMGGEGHVNSLFPDSPAVREAARFVVGVEDSPKPPPHRLTLTLPAVRRAAQVWLTVAGADKAEAVAAAVGGAAATDIPAAGAIGRERTLWLLDEEAAGLLPPQVRGGV
ncbi:6-phosphogluconolactonase [Mycolicibacterium brumae]|uniref:6-phosphogluconolactonase n=1 Tax=Mycolicibacterium brumae TaxID=85968 RepID=A0A2G5P9K5_9MYCO|nr:6-phosphogluconolactonase [Mycolicibacterium brumae]MCV7193656.1 6-phosphogluconolactonase [Mycolicibacterium brumae]PIB75048.1 6-phosphogluconolactonase [Mycolicibacterium brumae]RWA17355.1 hypothetical protein MBRU_06935 [Mycolicibacterium brumae DSM 44177]UWW09071.1 6-phosphogluconolactonase [Mycolicibacterium brumae]